MCHPPLVVGLERVRGWFIGFASSAFSDPSVAGRGFLARLSGSTAEFLSMWKLMFMGPNPFVVNDDGEVEMQLIPALPIWLFEDAETGAEGTRDDEGNLIVSFKLFASIKVACVRRSCNMGSR